MRQLHVDRWVSGLIMPPPSSTSDLCPNLNIVLRVLISTSWTPALPEDPCEIPRRTAHMPAGP